MTDHHDHDLYRDWSGAYVLGALEPAERADYERHLRNCETCRRDVSDFAALPGLLSQTGPGEDTEDDPAVERITHQAVARANHDYRRLEVSSRLWRFTAAAAAIVLVVTMAALGLTRRDDAGMDLKFEAAATGTISVDARPWGTRIDLNLAGLPERESYQLWAIDDAGTWIAAATWSATPDGLATLTGAAAVAIEDLDRVVITSVDRQDILVDAAT